MTYSLINKCAKNYYNRTFIVQVIAKNVVTCFFLRHSVVRFTAVRTGVHPSFYAIGAIYPCPIFLVLFSIFPLPVSLSLPPFLFSRKYVSNGRAIGMVVVCLSVTDVLWLNGARYGLGCC